MGPPPEYPTIRCGCLHCGQDGHDFEAIEMRWIVNEQMWTCPCTTCGGRGFHFDIHPVERVWQCAECGHWYTPEKFTYDAANCPKCGSTQANGWFDDSDEDEDGELFDEDDELMAARDGNPAAIMPEEDELPWEDDVEPYDPTRPDEDAEFPLTDSPQTAEQTPGEPRMLDDIDYPRHFERDSSERSKHGDNDEDDIPF